MTVNSRKRVLYVLPAPTYPVPLLSLPPPTTERLGKPGPILLRSDSGTNNNNNDSARQSHPRHRLGVSCLALDTSTILDGKTSSSPEGILYSGGRDGMVVGWDLGLGMKKRKRQSTDNSDGRVRNRWEYITGWADELCVSDDEEVSSNVGLPGRGNSDGDVLGDVTLPGTIRRKRILERLAMTPYENQWELDDHVVDATTTFRQSAQMHDDWVNDLLLSNYNQTVVSASSDGTVKAWNPHSDPACEPSIIGLHADYVRCIAHSREQRWVASGSFDRTIKLWDLSQSLSTTTTTKKANLEPVTTLSLPDNHHNHSVPSNTTATTTTNSTSPHSNSNSKSSIYALATDPFGHIIASGSPERVIRLWDPRTGKRTGKLVGHTDNIRAILVSDDCRYLLTGSADASIKLWSLVSQRCLHTFTHHTDSVWSLHSTHPSLLTFYSGDKSGMVCKLDVEAWCDSVSDGECVLVCADGGGGGITKIVSLDDHFIWTASGRSNINRWRVPTPRGLRLAKYREEQGKDTASIVGSFVSQSAIRPSRPSSISFDVPDLGSPTSQFDIPYENLIKLTSPNDPFFPYHRPGSRLGLGARTGRGLGRGSGISARQRGGGRPGIGGDRADVATLYSAASFLSIPRALTLAGIGPLNRTMFPGDARTNNQEGEERPTLFTSPSFSSLKPPSSYLPPPEHEHGTQDSIHLDLHSEPLDMHDPHHQLHHQLHDPHDILADLPILASDAVPYSKDPDHVIQGDSGLVRALILNDRIHVLTVDTNWEVAVWEIVRGVCVGRFQSDHEKDKEGGECKDSCKSPREALEAVRERIEGQGVTPKWASVDTKTGLLVVHLNERCFESEVYADEVGYVTEKGGSDETKINLGKWVLRNLFIGFVREERKARKDQMQSSTNASPAVTEFNNQSRSTTVVVCSPTMISALPPSVPFSLDTSDLPILTPQIPLIPIQPHPHDDDDDVLATPVAETLERSVLRPRIRAISGSTSSAGAGGGRGRPQVNVNVNVGFPGTPLGSATTEYLATPKKRTSATPVDEFSGLGVKNANTANANSVGPAGVTPSTPEALRPNTPNTAGLMNKLRSFGGRISVTRRPTSEAVPVPSSTVTTPVATTVVSTPTTISGNDNRKISSDHKDPEKVAVQQILSGPLSPPSSVEAPNVGFPPNTLVMISEDSSQHHLSIYRGTIGNTQNDVKLLEEVMPTWLLAYLLQNKISSQSQPAKISFVLLPWASKDPEEEKLPELLNTAQSKLTASRYLRVHKLVSHVHEKLDKIVQGKSTSSSPTSFSFSPATTTITASAVNSDDASSKPKPRAAEDLYEILCNDVLLPLDMTLAAVRQYVWKSSSELTMSYRLKDSSKRYRKQ